MWSDKPYPLIALNVENDLQVHILSVINPAWKILQKQFEFVTVTQIVRINRKFYAASMKVDADLMQPFNLYDFPRWAITRIEWGNPFEEIRHSSVPESYDNFLTSLNITNADDLHWENVKGLLIEEYEVEGKERERRICRQCTFVNRGRDFNRGRHQARGGSPGAAAVVALVFRISIPLKVLSLAAMNEKNTRESHTLNVTRIGTLWRTVRTITNRTTAEEKVQIWPNWKEAHLFQVQWIDQMNGSLTRQRQSIWPTTSISVLAKGR